MDSHRAIVFFSNPGNAFGAEAMESFVLLGGDGHTIFKADFSLVAVFHPDAQEVFLPGDGKVDQTFVRIRDFLDAFYGIVQGIPKQGA